MTPAAGFDSGKPYFVGYQRRWLADRSKRRCFTKSRRIGGTEVAAGGVAAAAAGVDLVTGDAVAPATQVVISASQNHSRAFLDRARQILRGIERIAGPLIAPDGDNVFRIELRNGKTITGLPANPAALRGHEGDVTIDEIGALPNADAIWTAAQPVAAPNLGNPEGYSISVVGTPLGDASLFHRIAQGDLSAAFSQHRVDVYAAIADGFPLTQADLEAFRAELDEEAFAAEYECSFLSSSARYISPDIYDAAAYDPTDRSVWDPNTRSTAGDTFYAGLDVGRRHDLTSLAKLRKSTDGVAWHTGTEVLRGKPWDEQEEWVDRRVRGCARVAVDATGLGSQFAERLYNRLGGRVDQCTFTLDLKEELATGMLLALERKRLRPRADDIETRREVLSLRREVTTHGNVRFDVQRTKRGHGDRAWALALALRATGTATRTTRAPVRELSEVERYVRNRYGIDRTRPWLELRTPRGWHQ